MTRHRLWNDSTDPLHGIVSSYLQISQWHTDQQTQTQPGTFPSIRKRGAFLEVSFNQPLDFSPVSELCAMKLITIISVFRPGCSYCSHSLWRRDLLVHIHHRVPWPHIHFSWLALSTWVHTAPETSKGIDTKIKRWLQYQRNGNS